QRNILTAEPHRTRSRRKQSKHGLEQSGLAGTVRTEQAKHFARVQRERQSDPDGPIAIAEGKAARSEHHRHPGRAVASSHRKNGAPMQAVKMPSGTSIAVRVRARMSTPTRNPPPSSKLAGRRRAKLGPTKSRAMCGITSPIQPTIPVMATEADVIN